MFYRYNSSSYLADGKTGAGISSVAAELETVDSPIGDVSDATGILAVVGEELPDAAVVVVPAADVVVNVLSPGGVVVVVPDPLVELFPTMGMPLTYTVQFGQLTEKKKILSWSVYEAIA